MARKSATLDLMFHSLADPNRRRMMERLSRGPASVNELARPVGIALPSALKHLKVLERGGMVTSEKAGRIRTYRMRPKALNVIEDWVAKRKLGWNRAFDRLEEAMASPEDSSGGR